MSWACQEERLTEAAKGTFTIALVDDTLGIQTKAQQAISDELAAQFQLTVRNAAGYTFYEGGYTADPITVPAGTYTVSAALGKDNDLAIDAPYYAGEASNVVVKATEAKTVTIPCQIANALVSVNWANQAKIDKVFTNYGVKVAVNSYSAILSPENSERKVYLKAGQPVSFYFVGTLISTREEKTAQLVSDQLPTSLQAADHCILTLTIDDRLAMQIEKAEIKQETINETIPLEWLPKPKVEGFANQATTLTYVETADAIPAAISFTTAHALQDVEFTLNLGDEQLQSLNKTYTLSSLTEAEKTALTEAGIGLPTLGETTGSLDLTTMTARLLTNNGESVNNAIKLRVKANDRWSAEADAAPIYTIQTVKPEFSVSVYPKNIWTKEFTVNELMEDQVITGSYAQLKAKMHYQYSADGTTWQTIGDDLCQKSLSPNHTYAVRAIYREGIYSNPISVTTYPETALSSGDMEDWTIEEVGYYYNTLAWNKNPVLSYSLSNWTTNNDYTTRYRDQWSPPFSTLYRYNTYAAVSCTKDDVHTGNWAAELRNTAAGRGNVSSNKSSYDFNNVPGELFLGTITVNQSGAATSPNDSYTITEGIAFSSKPTAIEFYYKYLPMNEDSWKAYVALYDENDQLMATKELSEGGAVESSYKKETIQLNYNDDLYAKPTKIFIYFASSNTRGSDLPYEEREVTIYKADGSTQSLETLSGSVLRIDDIQLIYDK